MQVVKKTQKSYVILQVVKKLRRVKIYCRELKDPEELRYIAGS